MEDAYLSTEDRNYYRDRRVTAEYIPEPPAGVRFTWIVCDLCEGRGAVVNANIDASGLTAEDFAEDPDFADGYRSGVYDIPCPQCRGRRVVPLIADKDPFGILHRAGFEHIECTIIITALRDLIAAGYWLSHDDGEAQDVGPTRDLVELVKAFGATGDDVIFATLADENGNLLEGSRFVRFIQGNGADILSDYSIDLEGPLMAANLIAEEA